MMGKKIGIAIFFAGCLLLAIELMFDSSPQYNILDSSNFEHVFVGAGACDDACVPISDCIDNTSTCSFTQNLCQGLTRVQNRAIKDCAGDDVPSCVPSTSLCGYTYTACTFDAVHGDGKYCVDSGYVPQMGANCQ